MTELSTARRFGLGAIALIVSALLLRSQISSALVVRGDELVARANRPHALALYRRAIWLDPENAVAVDRVAFTAMMTHDPAAIRSAIALSTAYLQRSPHERTLIVDRALCERVLKMQPESERDFIALGRSDRDPQAFTFAGYAALEQGAKLRARRWWRAALAIAPTYYPARHALARRFS